MEAETREVRANRVNSGTLAIYEGISAAILGFVVTVLAWISTGVAWPASLEIVLRGLQFGMVPGLGAVILGTVIYFIAGLILGYVHGGIFNLVLGSGGMEVGLKQVDRSEGVGATRPTSRRAEPSFGETIDHRRVDR
jgi:hypothetical protein